MAEIASPFPSLLLVDALIRQTSVPTAYLQRSRVRGQIEGPVAQNSID